MAQPPRSDSAIPIGGRDPGILVTMTPLSPTFEAAHDDIEIHINQRDLLRIFYDPSAGTIISKRRFLAQTF